MDLSLIIPTHQRTTGVMNLLHSLSKQDRGSLSIEVIVVSNLQNEKLETSLSVTSQFPFPVYYLISGSIGVNLARNKGIDKAQADLVLFLDDDVVIPDKTYLKKVYSYASSHPEAAAIGGRYILPEKRNSSDMAYFNISNSWLSHGKNKDNRATHLVGGNTLYNRKVLKHFLKFNENITFGGAETELNLRIFEAGFPLFLMEDIGLIHFTHLSPKELLRKAFFQGMGRAYHEQVVSPGVWKSERLAKAPVRDEINGTKSEVGFQNLLVKWFDLFFNIGYRHAKISQFSKFSLILFFKCFLIEYFHLDVEDKISDAHVGSDFNLSHLLRSKIKATVPWWRIPWFFKKFVVAHLWVFPWLFNWKLLPFLRELKSPLWKVPWFFRWKIIPLLLIWRRLPWWRIHWIMKYKILLPMWYKVLLAFWYKVLLAFWHKIRSQLWKMPAFFKYKIFSHVWRIPWFFKWRFFPGIIFLSVFTLSMFFPINVIGLGVVYASTLTTLERFIKKPWSDCE